MNQQYNNFKYTNENTTNSIEILNVEYGIDDKCINITDKVKEFFVKNGNLFISKNINLNNVFNDPYFGFEKEIKIDALINNKIVHICEKECSNHLKNDIFIYKNDLQVLNVEYGIDDKYVNITDKVKDFFLKNGNLFIPKNTNLNDIFGDPYFGLKKKLK